MRANSDQEIHNERQRAKKWCLWLWLSPLLTIPTLLMLYFLLDYLFWSLLYPLFLDSWNAYLFRGAIAVLASALWHLVLLIPARDKKSEFVRWHGRQAIALAGLRTAVPLAFIVIFNPELPSLLSILILIPIWLFGTLWSQRQAARGDCSLARWFRKMDALLRLPSEVEPVQLVEQSDDAIVAIVRFSRDPGRRQVALDQLNERGLVETLLMDLKERRST